ncbi:MAG: zinc-binding dehydrogenase [Lacunisphaera sp.]|jgi:3-hydroxyethyl bacteriochlorophyllide a dehydrogenase|nr:zinc-binding dehydrogenase [Lacunisphaera sp.]
MLVRPPPTPMKSHAVVFTAPHQVSFREIESPAPGPEYLVIELHHSWISNGTEGSFLRGERLSGDVAWRPGDPAPFPMVAGYQKVGRVLAVGSAAPGFAAGDWVFASMSRVCGMFDNQFAGHVSPSVCHHQSVQLLPAGADPLAFAGLVLTQVGYNCGSRAPITPGQTAVVVGDGLVGQWAGQTLARRGARVVMIGRHEARLARFRPHGKTLLSGPDHGVAGMRALGLGPIQVLVETVGSVAAMEGYLPLMERGGHMIIAGFYQPAGEVNLQQNLQSFRNREISFHLASGATRERLDETLRWVADGRLDTLGCLTHRFPVEDAAAAWQLIATKREPVLGVVLDWPASRRK